MNRKERLKLICDLVEQHQIDTQEEIVERLQLAGVTATQATVSRDMKALGITKIPTVNNYYIYGLPKSKQTQDVRVDGYIRRIDVQENMIHLDVEPGSTTVVKRRILEQFSAQVFSVMSDDDSILIIVRLEADLTSVLQEIREW